MFVNVQVTSRVAKEFAKFRALRACASYMPSHLRALRALRAFAPHLRALRTFFKNLGRLICTP